MPARRERTRTVCGVPPHLVVDIAPLAPSPFGALREEWTALQADASASPYVTFNWLESWAATYRSSRLRVVRIEDPSAGLVALGLLEELPLGGLRFAGVPVTPIRGLLCREGYEPAAWRALSKWLNDRSGWSWMDACGIGEGVSGLRGAVRTRQPWLAFELPGTFDEYLSARPPQRRRDAAQNARS